MEEFEFYHYSPSLTAAIIFTVLFALSAAAHLYQSFRLKAWFFIAFFLGCAFEVIGCIGRIISARQSTEWTLPPFMLQSIFLLLGPTLMAASIYMTLGRFITCLDANMYSLVDAGMISKGFVIADIISILAQSTGGGILAADKSLNGHKLGEAIIIAGLAIQIYFFAFFITLLHVFYSAVVAKPTKKALSLRFSWRRYIQALYVASSLIFVRSIFRIAEYAQGSDGELQSREIYIYVLDITLILLTTAIFNILHPGQLVLASKVEV
ncbi:Protein RTA1-like protein 1 [Colletotrichum truncatum]|uniref:Protein RTA1-like protein 1 n=1 Tax=Colletotrichum truncatum TaxID=5467 RepID=A0ACC3ZBN1_COLTU|nr:Protein RTA1-like protein 1 [Colletotrichum truncatum]KAF6787803.1 Protein RTA1-like protein 1 [Colletotrichum truncatum]